MACYCQSGSCSQFIPTGVIATRDHLIMHPELVPFTHRDFAQTTSRPAPYMNDWAAQVDLESQMRNFQNRAVSGALTSTRSFTVPLSWSMIPLTHQWQQPDNLALHQESSRIQAQDGCLREFTDSLEKRNYENLKCCPNAYYSREHRRTTLL